MPKSRALKIDQKAVLADDIDWLERCQHWQIAPSEPQRRGPARRQNHEPLILTGHGMRLRVDHGALVVRNGFTHYPQTVEERRFFPGDRNLPSRIIVLDGSGSLSFEVMTWLAQQKLPLVRIDWRGEVVTILGNGRGVDAGRVAAQLKAQTNGKALVIAASLIKAKIDNSAETLERALPASAAKVAVVARLRDESANLAKRLPRSISALLGIEGRVAYAYFKAWQSMPLHWKGTSRHPIPDDWHRIGPRQSALGGKLGKNKRASHPVNAMLNYAYAILESQVRMKIVAEGYDPKIGYLHSPSPDRDALVFDLMEPMRPIVDRTVLEFVRAHTFHPGDFTIQKDGVCRLNSQMARCIVQVCEKNWNSANSFNPFQCGSCSQCVGTSVTKILKIGAP